MDFGEAQKKTLNIISKDGTYSNLGMLLSDQCVATMKMAVFEGCKKKFVSRPEGIEWLSFITVGGCVFLYRLI